jgi:hypothetical protein
MNVLVSELLKFSDNILEKGEAISDDRINLFEEKNKLILPDDFRDFMLEMNGFNLMGSEVYGFDLTKTESIENVYNYEHFEVEIPQFAYLVPFSPDGRGNFYCIDTQNKFVNGDCPVVFWVSNYDYSGHDLPEITNKNFAEWVRKVVIEWILEDYDYDGFTGASL